MAEQGLGAANGGWGESEVSPGSCSRRGMSSRMAAGRKEGWGSQPHTHTNTISGFFFLFNPSCHVNGPKIQKNNTKKKQRGKERKGEKPKCLKKNKLMGYKCEGLRSLWHLPPPRGAWGDRGTWPCSRVGVIQSLGPRSLPWGWPAHSSPDLGSSLKPAGMALIRAGGRVL